VFNTFTYTLFLLFAAKASSGVLKRVGSSQILLHSLLKARRGLTIVLDIFSLPVQVAGFEAEL